MRDDERRVELALTASETEATESTTFLFLSYTRKDTTEKIRIITISSTHS